MIEYRNDKREEQNTSAVFDQSAIIGRVCGCLEGPGRHRPTRLDIGQCHGGPASVGLT
jgi:hypothetical protein